MAQGLDLQLLQHVNQVAHIPRSATHNILANIIAQDKASAFGPLLQNNELLRIIQHICFNSYGTQQSRVQVR